MAAIRSVYVAGSLANGNVPHIAERLRAEGFDAFDAWYSAGPDADKCWQAHETFKGSSYKQALAGYAARNAFEFDRRHLLRCDATVLVLPAGKSGHLELGWVLGQGRPGFILLTETVEKYDLMYQFATAVLENVDQMISVLKEWNGFCSPQADT